MSEVHRIRISIDVNSIKEHTFQGLIFVNYDPLLRLGIQQPFKTNPPNEVVVPAVEFELQNSFQSYTFDTTKEQLLAEFENLILTFNVFHQNKQKRDLLIGIATVNLQSLLKSPVRKTPQSYVRVLDTYYSIEENCQEIKKKIGLLRIILYLEDLGPVELLQQQQSIARAQVWGADLVNQSPINQIDGIDSQAKNGLFTELSSLEQKVIWELDTWRKTEEAKFKVYLRQTEYELTQKLYNEFKSRESEREKQFRQYFAQISQNELKIKQKAADLQRREQRLIQLEEEVKQKLLETAKIIKVKDEEQGHLIKRQKDEKLNWEKEKTILQIKLTDSSGQVQKLEEEVKTLKREMEKSPIALVKGTLQEKTLELTELKKELERVTQLKDQYKQYYEKMRDELVRQKQNLEISQGAMQKTLQQEVDQLKAELNHLRSKQEKIVIQQQLNPNTQQLTQNRCELDEQVNSFNNPFKNNLINNENSNLQNRPQVKIAKKPFVKQYPLTAENQSDLQRLIQEREYLLESGEYAEEDPFILELNRQIQELGV